MPSLLDEPALGEAFLTEVLASLVRQPSVNPGVPEAGVASVIERWLEPLGIDVRRVEFAPGRASVGARIRGGADGPTLVLNGHVDTVDVDDRSLWTVDPFGATVHDGRLYGRGACDMKAGIAVAIGVAHAVAAHRPEIAGSLVCQFAAGEERGEPGTLSLLEAGFTGDWGVVLEPTQLDIAAATRGSSHIRIRVRGRSIHASSAADGVNPLLRLGPLIEVLQDYDRELAARPHPLLPGGSCTPTMVTGGFQVNAVPDTVEVVVDRRLLPDEDAAADLRELDARVQALADADGDVSYELEFLKPPLDGAEIAADSPLVVRLAGVAERVLGERPSVYGTPFGSDVRNLVRDAGMEALTYGPGDVRECHCPDERVDTRQLTSAARVVAALADELLQRDGAG